MTPTRGVAVSSCSRSQPIARGLRKLRARASASERLRTFKGVDHRNEMAVTRLFDGHCWAMTTRMDRGHGGRHREAIQCGLGILYDREMAAAIVRLLDEQLPKD